MFRRFFSNSTLKPNLTFEFNKIANYSNYFELYNIDVLFFINKSELETKYNNLLKILNSTSFKNENEYSKYKNVLDNSYTTLINDLERAKYIINLKKILNNKSDDILNKESIFDVNVSNLLVMNEIKIMHLCNELIYMQDMLDILTKNALYHQISIFEDTIYKHLLNCYYELENYLQSNNIKMAHVHYLLAVEYEFLLKTLQMYKKY
jgi:hypothetical protein